MIQSRHCCRAILVAAVFVSMLHAEEDAFDGGKAAKLIESFAAGDENKFESAWNGLAAMGPPVLPQLIAALKDKNEKVREGAAQTMAQMGVPAAPAEPELLKTLAIEKNVQVISTILWAIDQSGVRSAEAEKPLAKLLEHEEPEIQAYAAILLAKVVGPPAHKYSTRIIENLPKCRTKVTAFGWTLTALCWLGVENADVDKLIPVLVDEWSRPGSKQQEHITQLFGKIGESALPAITDLLTRQQKSIARGRLLQAIGVIGPSAKTPTAEIVKWLADPETREAAQFALVATAPNDPKAKDLIELGMGGKNEDALLALSYGKKDGVAILEAGLGNANQTTRNGCAKALWHNLKAPECYDCILKILRNGTTDAQQALISQHIIEASDWFVFDKLLRELPESHPLRNVSKTKHP